MAIECAGVINFTPLDNKKSKSQWLNDLVKNLAVNNNMSESEIKHFLNHE